MRGTRILLNAAKSNLGKQPPRNDNTVPLVLALAATSGLGYYIYQYNSRPTHDVLTEKAEKHGSL